MDESSLITGIVIGAAIGLPLGILAGILLRDLLGGKETEFGSINVIRDEKGYPLSYEILPIGKLLKR